MKSIIYILILIILFSLPFVIGDEVVQLNMVNVCLLYEEGACVLEEERLEGDMRGLVRINENTGTANVLGDISTWRIFLRTIGMDEENIGQFNRDIDCSGALLCESERLRCSAVSDGKCPEDFGDWEEAGCSENMYTGGYCSPCDPDCQDCGQYLSIIVPDFIQYDSEGMSVSVIAESYGYLNRGRFILYDTSDIVAIRYAIGGVRRVGEIGLQPIMMSEIINCGIFCSYTFNVNINDLNINRDINRDPCRRYDFGVVLQYFENGEEYNNIGPAVDWGFISPYVEITNPRDGERINGNADLTANIEGDDCIPFDYFSFELFEDDENIRTVHNIEEYEEGEISYNWDTTEVPNGNYELDAIVIGSRDDKYAFYIDSVDVNINNRPPSPRAEFKILNIIIATIKSWL